MVPEFYSGKYTFTNKLEAIHYLKAALKLYSVSVLLCCICVQVAKKLKSENYFARDRVRYSCSHHVLTI